jgi:hypothetical protein
MQYVYLAVGLPPLSFDSPPEISFAELETLLRDNLTHKDYQKTRLLRRLYDILNLRAFWLGEPLDPHGGMDENQIEEALALQMGFPEYVYDFILRHRTKEERLRHFPSLLSSFFKESAAETKGFLRDYLRFEREWRLVFAGFRAKRLGRDLSVELQYEDPQEELIAQMLAQKDAKTYEPPERYRELKVLFEKYEDDPLGLERALDEYSFNFIEDQLSLGLKDTFSIDRILAYMAQLILVEKWFELDKKKGSEIIDTIVKETT